MKYQIQVLINGGLVFQEHLSNEQLDKIQEILRKYEIEKVEK